MKRLIAALLSSILLAGTLVAPAIAAKPIRGVTATVTTDADTSNIHAGDVVTFTATTNASWWKHELLCTQDGVLVMQGGWTFYPAGTRSVTLTLMSGAYANNPIGAECEVWVKLWVGFEKGYKNTTGEVFISEPLRFTLLP